MGETKGTITLHVSITRDDDQICAVFYTEREEWRGYARVHPRHAYPLGEPAWDALAIAAWRAARQGVDISALRIATTRGMDVLQREMSALGETEALEWSVEARPGDVTWTPRDAAEVD